MNDLKATEKVKVKNKSKKKIKFQFFQKKKVCAEFLIPKKKSLEQTNLEIISQNQLSRRR